MSGLLIAGRLTPTNVALRDAAGRVGIRSRLLPPRLALARAHAGEIVLGRIDVQASLAGPEAGLDALRELERTGTLVLNRSGALMRAHDKLATARVLDAAGLRHPRTAHVRPGEEPEPGFEGPYVVKPRFGSWGMGVLRCRSPRALRRAISRLEGCSWYREQGVLVQELVPSGGVDVRIVVACGAVVGAVSRLAAPHEWRTNVALGGRRKRVMPSLEARALALAAAQAVGADLVGVDLLPAPDGFVALELNGCVDFTEEYSLGPRNVFEEAVARLVLPGLAELPVLADSAYSRRVQPATS